MRDNWRLFLIIVVLSLMAGATLFLDWLRSSGR